MNWRFNDAIDLLRDIRSADAITVSVLDHGEPDAARVLLEVQGDCRRSIDCTRPGESSPGCEIPRRASSARSVDRRDDARDAHAGKNADQR